MARFTLSDVSKIAALLLAAVIMLTGNGLQGTLAPIRAEHDGFSTLALGVIGASFYVGFGLGCLATPRLLQRAGHARGFAVLTALTAAALLAHPMKVDPLVWSLLRAVVGFATAGMFAILESWLNAQTHNAVRGRIFTAYATVNSLALIAGNGLFSLGDPATPAMFSWAAMLTIACLIPIALTRQPEPPRPHHVQIRIGKLYKMSPAGFFGAVAVGLAGGAFWSLALTYAHDRGLDQGGIAQFMSTAILGGALAQWPMGRMSDFTDRRVVIMLAAGGAVLASLGLAFAHLFDGLATWVMFGAAFVYGVSAFPIGSLANAHLNDRAHADDVSETASGILLVYGSSAAVGPFAGALLMNAAGVSGLFYFTALVHVAYVAFVMTRMLQRGPAAHDAAASAIPTPAAALAQDVGGKE